MQMHVESEIELFNMWNTALYFGPVRKKIWINLNIVVKYLLKLHDGQQNRATVMSLLIVVILDISTNNFANEHSERDLTL